MSTDKEAQMREFARRLQKAMIAKGWNQSDLARAANMHMPDKREFGRHLINYYMRQRGLPSPVYLKALAGALDMEPTDLLPDHDHWQTRDMTGIQLKTIDGTNEAWLSFNQRIPLSKALQIMRLVQDEKT